MLDGADRPRSTAQRYARSPLYGSYHCMKRCSASDAFKPPGAHRSRHCIKATTLRCALHYVHSPFMLQRRCDASPCLLAFSGSFEVRTTQ